MRFRPIRWILNRSDQAGVFMAAATAASTFQRTLMPRNNLDQAIESGLSTAINYQIASLTQDGAEAVASLAFGLARGGETRADDDEMRRATLAMNAAGVLTGLAVQKLLAQTEGIFTETAGGVVICGLKRLVERGAIKRDEVTVAYITGNGLKTQEVVESLVDPVRTSAVYEECLADVQARIGAT